VLKTLGLQTLKKLFVGAITLPLAIRNLIFLHQRESSVMKLAGRTALNLMLNQNYPFRELGKQL